MHGQRLQAGLQGGLDAKVDGNGVTTCVQIRKSAHCGHATKRINDAVADDVRPLHRRDNLGGAGQLLVPVGSVPASLRTAVCSLPWLLRATT